MIKKVYFEITDVCNLSCSFCPKTKREKRFVSVAEFESTARKLQGKTEYLYLHLMGEPTLHPELEGILNIAEELGFKVIITTNGTTLGEKGKILLNAKAVYKISISVHSFEANNENSVDMSNYLRSCFEFAQSAASKEKICVFRLWNLDGKETSGENDRNPYILEQMRRFFGNDWSDTRSGKRLCNKIFLEYGEKFEWPDPENSKETDDDADCFCHGLRDQIGILCDGTVVPCCLDSEGTIKLGNIFDSSLEEIIDSPKAEAFYNSFTKRRSPHKLCSNCGYAERFSKNK